MDRTELLNRIYESRTRLESLLSLWDAVSMSTPELANGWSVKDLLAHLGWWQNRAVTVYRAISSGQEPDPINSDAEVDTRNNQVIADFRSRDLDFVRNYERQAFIDLINIVETVPEEDLFDPQRFAWLEGRIFKEIVEWNTYSHYEEHFPDLEKRAQERKAAQEPDITIPAEVVSPIVQRAAQFLRQEGRDIDQAIFDNRFGSLPVEDLLTVLGRYQNADGGFFGLEVDIQAPQSNPFATELALKILCWIDAPRDHALVQRTLAYLESTQDEEGNWRFTPEIYQHELAPWFQGWQWPNLNPSCSVAGLLKQLGLGSDRLHTRVQTLFDRLANPQDLAGNEYYNVRPYAYYFQTEWEFPQADLYRWGAVWWLIHQHYNNPDLDATHFMDFTPAPEAGNARRLPRLVLQEQLNRLEREQSPDGGWPTPYSPRWRSWNTISNLLILRAFGRI